MTQAPCHAGMEPEEGAPLRRLQKLPPELGAQVRGHFAGPTKGRRRAAASGGRPLPSLGTVGGGHVAGPTRLSCPGLCVQMRAAHRLPAPGRGRRPAGVSSLQPPGHVTFHSFIRHRSPGRSLDTWLYLVLRYRGDLSRSRFPQRAVRSKLGITGRLRLAGTPGEKLLTPGMQGGAFQAWEDVVRQ